MKAGTQNTELYCSIPTASAIEGGWRAVYVKTAVSFVHCQLWRSGSSLFSSYYLKVLILINFTFRHAGLKFTL